MTVVDRFRRHALLSGLVAACATTVRAMPPAPLRFGIVPHSSARVIVQVYQPLAAHLERELGQAVDIVTAPGFEAFGRQAAAQRYDLIMSTGALARYLQVDSGYRPLVRYTNDFKSLVLVAADGRIRQPSDLVAGRVVMLGRTSSTGVWAIDWLEAQKLHDVELRQVAAADSIAQLVLAGDAEAGVMSNANLLGLSPALRARLRVLAESPPLLGRVYMLSARLGTQAARFEAALLSYAETDAGRAHLARFELGGLRRVVRGDMEPLDPMLARVRRELVEIREPDLVPLRRDLAARTRP